MGSQLNNHRKLARIDGCLVFAMALASVVYANSSRIPPEGLKHVLVMPITVMNAAFAGVFILLWGSCFESLDLYRPSHTRMLNKLARTVLACGLMAIALAFYLEISRTASPATRIALTVFFCSLLYEGSRILWTHRIAISDPQLIVILGSGPRAARAWREIRSGYHGTVRLVGFVDDRPSSEMPTDVADRLLGTVDDLSELLLRNVVDELLVTVPMRSCYDIAQRAIEIAERVGVRVVHMQDVYVTTIRQNAFRNPELFSDLVPIREKYVTGQVVKRFVDIVGSLVGLCILLPLFLVVALAIKATSKGPVFFVQDRYGYRRRLFRMYKFRSMVSNAPQLMAKLESHNEAGGPIFKIRKDPRITPLGQVLRASSIDELPQLWNVLIGNMSLVGPRPMSVRDVSLFSEAALMRRFTVKPGITGLWQVSGRNTLSFEKWIEMDFKYIETWSLILDFRILARTVRTVLRGTGSV